MLAIAAGSPLDLNVARVYTSMLVSDMHNMIVPSYFVNISDFSPTR